MENKRAHAIDLILSAMFGSIIRLLVPHAKRWLDAHAAEKQKDMRRLKLAAAAGVHD